MTKTIQQRTWVTLSETRKDLTIQKPEIKPEDFISDLLSLYDNLSILYEELKSLNYLVEKNLVKKHIFHFKRREE